MKNYKFSNYSGAYLDNEFTKHINKNDIRNIVEMGARECKDTIALAEYYSSSSIYAFECNPDTIGLCEHNLNLVEDEMKKRIHFFPYGVGSKQENKKFYRFVQENNPGASSFLPRIHDFHKQQETEQVLTIVKVENIIEKLQLNSIDLVCADIQGFELEALKGFGKYLNTVKYIITEIPKEVSLYKDAPSREEMLNYFKMNNFEIIQILNENLYEDNILLKRV
jgi:hypothetical protein